MKATNTEHTVINGNQSKCRMTQFNLGGALTKSGDKERSTQGDESKSPRGASLFVLSLHKDFPALPFSLSELDLIS